MNKILLTLLIIFVSFSFTGCNSIDVTPSSHNDVLNSSMNSIISGDIVKNEVDFINTNDILIHKISRDVYQEFLNQPSCELLKKNILSTFSYANDGEWFVTSNGTRFRIGDSLVDFLQNNTNEYLSQHNVRGNVEHMVLLSAPKMPITLWVKTSEENCYITINEEPEDMLYIYRYYTQTEYNNKYVCKKGKLLVNNKEILTENLPKIYNDYADIPFLSVMKSLGADIQQQNEKQFLVSFKNKVYTLDIHNCSLYVGENTKDNFFNKVDGGVFFKYSVENDVMVDSVTLGSVLYDMGQKITVKTDLNNSCVVINVR